MIVSGPPGSGKTQLARALARAVPCPAICRDEIKEGMVHALGAEATPEQKRALNPLVHATFFDALRLLLTAGVTVVAEAAFQDRAWRPGIEPLLALADIRIVQCVVSDAVAFERIVRRAGADPSRAAHDDSQLMTPGEGWWKEGAFQRISIGAPSLEVDTTDGYRPRLEEIVSFTRRS